MQPAGHHAHAFDRYAERNFAIFRLAVLVDDHHEFLVLVGADGAFADQQHRLGFGLSHQQPRELARHQPAIGVVEHRTHPHGAAARIDLVVDQLHLPLVGCAVGGAGPHLHRDASDLGRRRFVRERPQCPRHHLLIGIEAGINRIDRDQRGQNRGARSGGDQIADGDLELADPPGDRRAYFGIAEIEFRRLQRRFGRLQIGFGLTVGVDATVKIALRDRARIRQLLAALEIALGEDQARLGRGHLALGARHIGRIQRRIDQDQQVSLFDKRTLRKVDFLNRACDPGADFDPFDGLKPAGKLVPRHGLPGRDDGDRDRQGRACCCGRLGLRAAASTAQESRACGDGQGGQHQPCPNQAFVFDDIFHGDPNSAGHSALLTPV